MPYQTNKANAYLQFLEACYAWEREDSPWLETVLDAAVDAWGKVIWSCAFLYDATDVERFQCERIVVGRQAPPPEPFVQRLTRLPPEFVVRNYRTMTAGFSRALGAHVPPMFQELEPFGSVDIFGINGTDPSGVGCMVALGTERSIIPPEDARDFVRLSAHLSSAYRCRRRLARQVALETAEAVFDSEGRLLDARGPCSSVG